MNTLTHKYTKILGNSFQPEKKGRKERKKKKQGKRMKMLRAVNARTY
jgi:hypothetical protein